MKDELKILLGLGVISAIIIGIAAVFSGSATNSNTNKSGSPELVRENSNIIGVKDSKVTLVEFGDYQCPACGAAEPIISRIVSEYKDKIRFVFRNFPLPSHRNAKVAARAAEAAGDQGKYWEMSEKLYQNQNEWSDKTDPRTIFIGYAESLGLKVEQFRADLDSDKYNDKIERDYNDGIDLGVSSTPTFFFNGEKQVGVQDYNKLKKQIDDALK